MTDSTIRMRIKTNTLRITLLAILRWPIVPIALATLGIVPVRASTQTARSAVEEFRVGQKSNDTMFTRADLVVALPEGGAIVGDPARRRIVIFDRNGHATRSFGGNGGGPGEFHYLSMIGVRSDSIWASDASRGRLTVFGPNGKVIRTMPQPVDQIGMLSSDGLVASMPVLIYFRSPKIIKITRMDTEERVVAAFEIGTYKARRTVVRKADGSEYGIPQIWDDFQLVRLSPTGSGIVMVERRVDPKEPHFVVTFFDPLGKVFFRKNFQYQPRTVEEADIRTLIERGNKRIEWHEPGKSSSAEVKAVNRQFRATLYVPPHMVPVSDALIAADGSIWVGRDEFHGERQWLVLDSHGTPKFNVALPADYSVKSAFGSIVWCTTEDEDGRNVLIRMRLQ